ncbi:MAG: peptidoglycan bridge formation glycyltransferase FemA/FemB family protein [Pseudomonadota bacterium]
MSFHSPTLVDGCLPTSKTAIDQNPTLILPLTQEIELKSVSALEWDNLASQFKDIIPEQMASFNLGHWGEGKVEFITFWKNSTLAGGAVLIVREIPLTGSGIAILKWGPLCWLKGRDWDHELYHALVAKLKDEICHKRNLHLTIMPSARPIEKDEREDILLALGFKRGAGLAAPERYLVNVKEDPRSLMKNLDQKWRYNLRKALKNDFKIEIATPERGLDAFLTLYRQMMDRKQFLDASAIDALEKIMEDSPEAIKPIIVLVSHQGKITAGGVFHVAGNMASYMFGATDDRALKLKAGYALHWWVAEMLCKEQSVDWYDLGGNDLDKGLHQFKKGFVGKSGHILMAPPRYHHSSSLISNLAGYAAFQLRDVFSSFKRTVHTWTKR